MTLLLQYNVKNYILDGVYYLWRSRVLPGGEFVSAEQGSVEFSIPINIGIARGGHGRAFALLLFNFALPSKLSSYINFYRGSL